jgi:hypothetical protein
VKGDCIDDIEDFLIGYASRRNANLINIHGTRSTQWSISGVANHNNGGHPGGSVVTFKKMMGMTTRKDKVSARPDASDAIEPEKVESVMPNTDEAADIDKEAHEEDAPGNVLK